MLHNEHLSKELKTDDHFKSETVFVKKAIMLFCFMLWLTFGAFGQNSLTPEQIRRHASELGVPYEALKQFVESYRVQTGLKNPNAKNAQMVSLQEIQFMRESDKLKVGSFYRIKARYSHQNGRRVSFRNTAMEDYAILWVDADFVVSLKQDVTVDALIGVKADYSGRPRELFLAEIALARY